VETRLTRRHKTVELIVETVPWRPNARQPRRRDEEMVAARIGYGETDLRERAKRLGIADRDPAPCCRTADTILFVIRLEHIRHTGVLSRA